MRMPTPSDVAYAWWRQALLIPAYERAAVPNDPMPGFYKRRLVRGGPFVPVHIYLHQEVCPETGDLLDDEELVAEVNGDRAPADEVWSYVASSPISEAEFNYLTARGQWASLYAPTEAAANPRRPIDWNSMQPPAFT